MPEKTRLLIRVVQQHQSKPETELFLPRDEIIALAKQDKLKWDTEAGVWRDVR